MILTVSFVSRQEKLKIFLAGDSTMSVKAVSAYPETGWGMPFTHFWNQDVEVVNKAKNGRSTKTFQSEGIWQTILEEGKSGDYVFIQFGHNDEVITKVGSYTTPTEYSGNLSRFVNQVRDKNMIPILMTPVSRRKFDEKGNAQMTHEEYSQLVRIVAQKDSVTLIDMDQLTMKLYQDFGPVHSKLLFLQLKPGEHPNYPEGKEDNTHFNELGARLVAEIVLKEIRTKIPALIPHIITTKAKA
jgi:lysophospholipase L1-like esterase